MQKRLELKTKLKTNPKDRFKAKIDMKNFYDVMTRRSMQCY